MNKKLYIKNKFILRKKKTNEIDENLLNLIINLKDKEWKYGLVSQKEMVF